MLQCVRVKRARDALAYKNPISFPEPSATLFITAIACERRQPKAGLVGLQSIEHWSWAGGRRPPLSMQDRLLHLRFQASWLRPILSSDRFPHQLIARGFQMTLLPQARHITLMQVLLPFPDFWVPYSGFQAPES